MYLIFIWSSNNCDPIKFITYNPNDNNNNKKKTK